MASVAGFGKGLILGTPQLIMMPLLKVRGPGVEAILSLVPRPSFCLGTRLKLQHMNNERTVSHHHNDLRVTCVSSVTS